MIVETFPPKKKPVIPYFQQEQYQKGKPPHIPTGSHYARQWVERKAAERGITADEYLRRDNVIKALVECCPFTVGQIGYPHRKADYEKFGPMKVMYFVKNLDQMPKDEKWPTNDNPFIMTCGQVNDPGKMHNCTTNYLISTNVHLGEQPAC